MNGTWIKYALALSLLGLTPAHAFDARPAPVALQGSVQALFSPWDNVEGALVDAIAGAKQQVLMQAYLLTSKKIVAALITVHRRGVDVRVLVDAAQLGRVDTSGVRDLVKAGIPVWKETRYQNAHNKIILIDAATKNAIVITGSYNFTWTAQHRNAENILIVRGNPALAGRYVANWERHRNEAMEWHR